MKRFTSSIHSLIGQFYLAFVRERLASELPAASTEAIEMLFPQRIDAKKKQARVSPITARVGRTIESSSSGHFSAICSV